MPLVGSAERESLRELHQLDVLTSRGHPGRVRRIPTIPIEKIRERRQLWLSMIVGKTTA
jgi:hypothetical protein